MLVAFHSKGQQAGKDSAADFASEWCSEHDRTYERLAFADQMKLLVAAALGVGGEALQHKRPVSPVIREAIEQIDTFKLGGWIDWAVDENQPVTTTNHIDGRDFIINLAEGARRLFGTDFWTDQCLPRGWAPSADYTFITDLCFPEEANRVAELGGIVVEVVNPRAVNQGGRSEEGLDPLYIDLQQHNTGTIDQWATTIQGLMETLERTKSRA